jgi:hypothetical protein
LEKLWPKGATDLDVLTRLFKQRQYRAQCESAVKELAEQVKMSDLGVQHAAAKAELKACKEIEARIVDEIGGHIMLRRDEERLPKLDLPRLVDDPKPYDPHGEGDDDNQPRKRPGWPPEED